MKTNARKTQSVKVLKFGGTCLFPARNRAIVLDRIQEAARDQNPVVAVVSAMGREGDPYATDTLAGLLPDNTSRANRERDALLSYGEGIASSLVAAELLSRGVPSVSMGAFQLGLLTDGRFGNAEILSVDPSIVIDFLNRGFVVVAAGFQGIGEHGSLTLLSRGGSDTVAVALAASLKADKVQLYKGVEGLFNADPRIVPAARPLQALPYDEAANMAYAGARVLHPRAADMAKNQGISLEIKGLESDRPGTLVTSREAVKKLEPSDQELFALACVEQIGQVQVSPAHGYVDLTFPVPLFADLARAGISLDLINVLEDRALFTVAEKDLQLAAEISDQAGCRVTLRAGCAKVSVLGGAIHGVPGIMSRILSTLSEVGARVLQSVDTNTVISILLDKNYLAPAAQALHRAFRLDQEKTR